MGAQPNNKGNPVKQYEPYFSNTFEFEDEDELVETGVTPIIHYDALDRVIRTELPNKTETRVVFDAWRQETWDPNDTVLETEWYSDRGSPLPTAAEPSDPETRAAWLAARHAETPTVAHFDTLGRTFLVVAHNRTYASGTPTDAFYRTRSELDIEGNVLRIFDARQHATSAGSDDLNASPAATITQRYDVLGRRLRTDSPDAGSRLTIADVAGKPLRAWDNREQVFRAEYDVLQRQTHFYVADSGGERLVTRTVYGEALDPTGPSTDPLMPSAAQADNLRGRVYQVYDSAGLVTNESFDFKGNLLNIQRRLAIDYQTTPDWSVGASETLPSNIETAVSSLLETEVFSAQSEYDALNRVTAQTAPDGSVTTPTYNEANLLERLHVGVKGGTSQRVIEDLNYNARGQRLECLHNNPTTEAANYQINYSYDPETFRVTRVFTERASDGILLQDLRYTYDPVGNITEIRDLANTTPVFSGTAPVDAHARYEYDATYRLTQATGREHPGQQQPGPNDLGSGSVPHPNDLQALVRYTERYIYDGVGNLERHQHIPEGGSPVPGWTRRYNYATDSNRLLGTSNPGDPEGTFSTQYSYNAHGSMTSMSHLQQIDWDYAERMSHANQGGGGDIYFTYDAAGERVRKVWVHTGLIEERIYLGNVELYRRRQGSTLQVERETLHVFDDQRRVAMVETKNVDTIAGGTGVSRWRFQLDNHLGTAVLEVDHEGSVISYEEYHPFGTTAFHTARGSAEVSAKRYRYTGKEKDELTQLYYHGARYYAPWLGRWTAADPAGPRGGINLYEYAASNPLRLTDPNGRAPRNADGSLNDADPNVQRLRAKGVSDASIQRLLDIDPRKRRSRAKKAAGGGSDGAGGEGGSGSGASGGAAGSGGEEQQEPNDPPKGEGEGEGKGSGKGEGKGGGAGEGVEESSTRSLAEAAGAVTGESAEEGGSATGIPGGGAEKGSLLDNEAGQALGSLAIIGDFILTVFNLGKLAIKAIGFLFKKIGKAIFETVAKFFSKGVDEAVDEAIEKGAKEGIEELVPRATAQVAKSVDELVDDVFRADLKEGRDLFGRARNLLTNSPLSGSAKAEAFEKIANRINRIDPSWMANRGPATNAAGFFTGDARPFGFAIDSQGRIWQTPNFINSVKFGPGGATIDFSKWTLVQ